MKKALPIIMAIIMVASILVFFVSKSIKKNDTDTGVIEAPTGAEVSYSLNSSEYTSKISVAGQNGEIYLPTDKDGLYYTANLKNEIKFWNYSDGAFTPASYEVKTASVTLNVSTQQVPVTISYIDADGLIVGYGVFTSDMNPNAKVYSYAFLKIAKSPAGYGDGYMLLADFTKEDFYKADKVYSEFYSNFVPGSTSSVYTGLSQNTRLVDNNGYFKQTWSMMTDEFMANEGSQKLFISSRYYNSDESDERSDIMIYSSALRPTIVAKDIRGNWFVSDEAGYHYIVETDGGFKTVTKLDGEVKDGITFSGDWSSYLRCGNYIVSKETNEMTNLLTGEKKTLEGINIKSAVIFSINGAGTRMVFASPGVDNGNGTPTQILTYYSTDSAEKAVTFTEPLLWNESTDFVWVSDSAVMSGRAVSDDGAVVGSVIYTFAAA